MPYRLIVDSTGTEWQVWDVVPQLSERRSDSILDRRVEIKAIPFADRRQQGRRLRRPRRAILRGAFAHGWLCFESDGEKRRLSPIPDDWTTCSEEQIELYLRHAESVPHVHHFISFSDEGPIAEGPLAEAG